MNKENKIPLIRFKGYTEDWEQRKLGEMMNVTSVKRIHQSDWTSSGVRFLRARDIVAAFKNEEPSDYLYISEEKYNEYSSLSGKVKIGDLLVTGVGTIGVPMLINSEKPLYFKDGNIIWFQNGNEIDGDFFYYSFTGNSIQNFIQESAGTGTVGTYTIDSGKKTPIVLPQDIAEQQQIGTYFQSLDNLITLHQRKCESLKKVKKSMLQKMFPKNGESVPEIRFAGFTDPWEQRKLGEVYASIGNAFVGTATPYYVEQGHFYLESNNIKDGQINRNSEIFINDEFYEKQKDKWLHTGDIVMVQSGHVGHAAVIPEELDNSAAHALIMFRRPKENIEPYFLNYQYQTNKSKKKIEEITTGNTIKHILASDMQEFVVDLPNYPEQQKIGSYFQNLDNLITLHQRKVEKLKNIKKSMLQKMFV